MKELVIREYKVRPKWKYFDINVVTPKPSKNKLYIGIELEYNFLDLKYQKQVLTNWKLIEPWWIATKDMSINRKNGKKGLELVSHPFTYDWLINNRYHFVQACEVLKQNKVRINKNCGMHVHLTRSMFTPDHLYAFQKLIYDNKEFTEKISRRPKRSLSYWASLQESEEKLIEKSEKTITINDGRKKYTAVNTCHRNSIEIRIFRSTIQPEEIFTSVEYCIAAYEYTKESESTDLTGYLDWVSCNKKTFPHLFDFINE